MTPAREPSFLTKYFYVLHDERRRLWLMAALFASLSVFDLLGVGLIGPFVGALLEPKILHRAPAAEAVLAAIAGPSSRDQLLALAGILAVLFVVKGFVAFGVQRAIFGFSFGFRARLVEKLMAAYLRMPYQFYLRRNSSSLVQTVTAHTKTMADDLLIPSLRLVSDGSILILMGGLLAWVSPFAVLALGLMLGGALGAYVRFVRPKVRNAGAETGRTNERIIRGVTEGIGGIKEIRVLRAEEVFFKGVSQAAQDSAVAQRIFNSLLILPRYLMETVLVLFVILFAAFVIVRGSDGVQLVTVLAMFAAAGVRLLPAITQVSASLASMNYSAFTLNELYRDLREIETMKPISSHATGPRSPFERLTLTDLTYRYPDSARAAIDGISIDVARGASIGLIGESGAGKTTLVDILLGLHPHDTGTIEVNGVPIERYGWDAWVSQVAYIPQNVFLLDASLAANVAFGIAKADISVDRVHTALAAAQLTSVAAALPDGINTRLGERGFRLSGGERQRIGLARAFYLDRDVLILDEATSALDVETERQVTEVIRGIRGRKTLIVIAHRLTTVRECDIIHRLDRGRLIQSGSFEEVVGDQ